MYYDARVLLADVENAAADIERYLDGVDRIAYIGADEKQAAVERKFEIIGEALNRLHVIDPDLSQRIPQLRRIVDFRNLLSHGYDRVRPERVWTYANNNLPELRRIVQALITELGLSRMTTDRLNILYDRVADAPYAISGLRRFIHKPRARYDQLEAYLTTVTAIRNNPPNTLLQETSRCSR